MKLAAKYQYLYTYLFIEVIADLSVLWNTQMYNKTMNIQTEAK